MRMLHQRFSEPLMEKEYSHLIQATNVQMSKVRSLSACNYNVKVIIFFWVCALIAFSLSFIINGDIILGIIFLSSGLLFIILSLALLNYTTIFHANLFKVISILFSVGSLVIFLTQDDNTSRFIHFTRGWYFNGIQTILLTQFHDSRHKFLILVLSLFGRFFIMGLFDKSILTFDTIIGSILSDSFVNFIFFSFQKRERGIFKNYFKYQQEHIALRSLIDNLLPQSITIFNAKTTEPIFSNKASLNLFSFSQPKTANKLLMPPLGSLKVELDKLKEIGSFNLSSTSPEGMSTLQSYIQELQRANLAEGSSVSIPVSCIINKEKKYFEARVAPLIWEFTHAIGLVLNDVSIRETINELKGENENKDLTIATVAHELRTPLGAIIGLLEISRPKVKDSEALEYISHCKDNANLLLSLVNSLLDLQMIRYGKFKLNPSLINIRKLVSEIMQLFYFSASQKGIYMEFEFDENVPENIVTDGNRLKQILINLIGNALKFTFNGGVTVAIIEDLDAKYLKFIVADTGIGIKEEQRKKLFQRYSKADDPEGLNKGGIGLGLTIASSLAKLLQDNDGKKGIELESNFGEGSKFWFVISKYLKSEPLKEENKDDEEIISEKLEDKEPSLEVWRSIDIDPGEYDEALKPYDIELRLATYSDKKKNNQSYFDSSLKISKNTSRENLFLEDSSRHVESIGSPLNRFSKPATPSHFSALKRRGYENFSPVYKGNILIVDDNAFNLLIAKNIVENLGYYVEIAMDGETAIAEVKRRSETNEQFKLIFMDIQMPVMDGFEIAKALIELMKKKEIENIPIVALTAAAQEKDFYRCLEYGMKDCLTKPFTRENFIKVMSQLQLGE